MTEEQDRHNGADLALQPAGAVQHSVPALAEEARAAREVEAAMVVAKRFPRNTLAASQAILNECTRPSLAEVAVYEYTRGGSAVTGPSIRLAEVIAQNWGNLTFGLRELDRQLTSSVMEAYCWDLQTNVRRTVTFSVPHVRVTKRGRTDLTDPRDVYEMVANQGARRMRSCILAVVPGDVIEAAVEECERTITSKADTSPEAVKKMVAAFTKFGVTTEQIEARIGRHLDAIRPAQVLQLRKIYNSLKEGMSDARTWFPPTEDEAAAEAQGGVAGLKSALAKQQAPPAAAAPKESETPSTAPAPGDAEHAEPDAAAAFEPETLYEGTIQQIVYEQAEGKGTRRYGRIEVACADGLLTLYFFSRPDCLESVDPEKWAMFHGVPCVVSFTEKAGKDGRTWRYVATLDLVQDVELPKAAQ